MKRILIIMVMVSFIIFILFSCKSDDDDTSEKDDDDEGDDEVDDDTDDDNTDDDDSIVDDDTVVDNSPRIIDAYWDPNPTELGGLCADNEWCSVLTLHLCDPDNDLLPLGSLWIEPSFVEPSIMLDELYVFPGYDLGEAGDCSQPQKAGLPVVFGYAEDPNQSMEFCVDIEVADSASNFSDRKEDICVIHNEE